MPLFAPAAAAASYFNQPSANITELKNGLNSQTLRVFAREDGADKEYFEIVTVAGDGKTYIRSGKAGGFSEHSLALGTGALQRLIISAVTGNIEPITNVVPGADNSYDLGSVTAGFKDAHMAGYLAIGDGIAAPGAGAGEARIYVDTADGDLKIVFADGTVKVLSADT